jgi:hypothetical protein
MAASDGGAQAQATELETKQRLLLRDLEEKGISFYWFLVEKTIHKGLAVAAWTFRASMTSHDLA